MKGKELKVRRQRLGLTQVQLANIFEVRSNTVARWENGVSPIPKLVALAMETVERSFKLKHSQKKRATTK